jgi:uncharacterized protein (TIGR01440 family)
MIITLNFNSLTTDIENSLKELLEVAKLEENDIVVVGCSTSEVGGKKIGTSSSMEIAEALMSGILPSINEHKVFLAIQCCEHLNRALVVEKECSKMYNLDIVTAIPHRTAGGSMGEYAMSVFKDPVLVEQIKGHAALDIGDTLVGMHIKRVAVPFRMSIKEIGEAHLTAAYRRHPLIGGKRAHY